MAGNKLHRSQMTMAERERARNITNGVDLAGRYVRSGGSLEETPTDRDIAMTAKWRDAPLAGHQSVTFKSGPDFDKLLSDDG